MTLYGHRVFSHRGQLWVAIVHEESEAVVTDAATVNTVYFTCLSDETHVCRRAAMPRDNLHRFSHRAMAELLDRAESTTAPPWALGPKRSNELEFDAEGVFRDDEGLRWVLRDARAVVRSAHGYALVPALQVVCLDDSALKKEFTFSGDTHKDIHATLGDILDGELVKLVKDSFEELDHKGPKAK